MRIKSFFGALVILTLFSSCEEVFLNCNIKVETCTTETSDTTSVATTNLVGHLFYCDTLDYRVDNYSDALNGVMTSNISSATINSEIDGLYSDQIMEFTQVHALTCTLVIVDTLNNVYGYKKQDVSENLAEIYLYFNVMPYKFEDGVSEYSSNGWRILKSDS